MTALPNGWEQAVSGTPDPHDAGDPASDLGTPDEQPRPRSRVDAVLIAAGWNLLAFFAAVGVLWLARDRINVETCVVVFCDPMFLLFYLVPAFVLSAVVSAVVAALISRRRSAFAAGTWSAAPLIAAVAILLGIALADWAREIPTLTGG